ncbi:MULTISPECIES: helix-turn-helix transcriptional regulator [Vibrio harveyi group]|uniref:helix-turn-helix transcriptional regulator n=1 Tax=Vibrio harveyi group TaxID=717610 RepID=UPI001110734E|nr:hypothetical protein [Vibrio parahaemolyticus]MDG2761576.1 hypothetical protein [Vibrio parahaemolyticus]TMX40825.1 hypothetical protein DA098_03065 [Vibrio parahaemolyticus]TMX79870.1 hypothetical protein DA094_05135 [Vibrio parahaemolyticus]
MEEKLISIETLLKRYRVFAAKDGENFTKRGIYNWRKNKGFPEPVISSPRLVFKTEDVLAWEKKQGYEGLL